MERKLLGFFIIALLANQTTYSIGQRLGKIGGKYFSKILPKNGGELLQAFNKYLSKVLPQNGEDRFNEFLYKMYSKNGASRSVDNIYPTGVLRRKLVDEKMRLRKFLDEVPSDIDYSISTSDPRSIMVLGTLLGSVLRQGELSEQIIKKGLKAKLTRLWIRFSTKKTPYI